MLETWDIDRFPLKIAAPTPGQIAAEKWLRDNPEKPLQPVDSDTIRRLINEDRDTQHSNIVGAPTGGGGISEGGGMHYGPGYNQPGRVYPGQADREPGSSGYYMPGVTHHPLSEDDEDHDEDTEPEEYHIVTRPRDAIHGLNVFDEHPYSAFGNAYEYNPSSAMDMFAEDHPEYDTERYPDTATHEIVSAHPAEHHDDWHRDLADEDAVFNNRIAPHGLQRESPEVPGHRVYRYETGNGIVHRLWHSPYSANGPGWVTSRYDPNYERENQLPWTEHPDSASEDSLGDALAQIRHNRAHVRG